MNLTAAEYESGKHARLRRSDYGKAACAPWNRLCLQLRPLRLVRLPKCADTATPAAHRVRCSLEQDLSAVAGGTAVAGQIVITRGYSTSGRSPLSALLRTGSLRSREAGPLRPVNPVKAARLRPVKLSEPHGF
ncbi:hypothetical protein COCOBI_16-2100 [Coccomyxa sp. Obi]|nr:hypothetical protein COCOBI_16-2100 [Coccomyxa sp. Obi]